MHLHLWMLGKSLLIGFIVGAFFTALRLPIPAPDELGAIVGIIGIYLGMLAIRLFL
jgi:XapX domain-containing protein